MTIMGKMYKYVGAKFHDLKSDRKLCIVLEMCCK